MLPIKALIIGGVVFNAVIGFMSGASAQKAQLQTCKTWQQVKPEIQMIYMGAIGATAIPDMPKGFQKGCVFGDFGAYTISFYVLKDGLKSANMKPEEEGVLDFSIPRVNSANPNIQKAIKNGDILRLFNVCSSTVTLNFCKGIPSKKAYTKDGLVCLRNLCMQANGVKEQELENLWNAVRNQ